MAMPLDKSENKVQIDHLQGAPIKNNPLEKKSVFQPWEYGFEPNLQSLYASIQATYPANFIEITYGSTDTAV